MQIGVIIPAAGLGRRMGSDTPKQYLELAGKPLIFNTLQKFRHFEQLKIVVEPARVEAFRAEILQYFDFPTTWEVVAGGEARQDSVRNGFLALSPKTELVLVHDGVRPLISRQVIDAVVAEAERSQAAIVAVSVKDTIKEVTRNGKIVQTVDRSKLWRAQTPQVFSYALFARAQEAAQKDGFLGTDEASLVERLGVEVSIVPGDETNIKVTTPEDLVLAEQFLRMN